MIDLKKYGITGVDEIVTTPPMKNSLLRKPRRS